MFRIYCAPIWAIIFLWPFFFLLWTPWLGRAELFWDACCIAYPLSERTYSCYYLVGMTELTSNYGGPAIPPFSVPSPLFWLLVIVVPAIICILSYLFCSAFNQASPGSSVCCTDPGEPCSKNMLIILASGAFYALLLGKLMYFCVTFFALCFPLIYILWLFRLERGFGLVEDFLLVVLVFFQFYFVLFYSNFRKNLDLTLIK